jgi:hypothetical protein
MASPSLAVNLSVPNSYCCNSEDKVVYNDKKAQFDVVQQNCFCCVWFCDPNAKYTNRKTWEQFINMIDSMHGSDSREHALTENRVDFTSSYNNGADLTSKLFSSIAGSAKSYARSKSPLSFILVEDQKT